jgi:hypothetical protein
MRPRALASTRSTVAAVRGACTLTAVLARHSWSNSTGRTPRAAICVDGTKGSCASTFIPKAWARRATLRAMAPKPSRPTTHARSSSGSGSSPRMGHRPAAVAADHVGTPAKQAEKQRHGVVGHLGCAVVGDVEGLHPQLLRRRDVRVVHADAIACQPSHARRCAQDGRRDRRVLYEQPGGTGVGHRGDDVLLGSAVPVDHCPAGRLEHASFQVGGAHVAVRDQHGAAHAMSTPGWCGCWLGRCWRNDRSPCTASSARTASGSPASMTSSRWRWRATWVTRSSYSCSRV